MFYKHLHNLLIHWFITSAFSSKSSEHLHSQTVRARELTIWENVHITPPVPCHVSCVMCHKSYSVWQTGGASLLSVSYQRGLLRFNFCFYYYQKNVYMYNQVCSIKQVYEIINKKDNNMKLCKYRTIQIVKCHTIHKKIVRLSKKYDNTCKQCSGRKMGTS